MNFRRWPALTCGSAIVYVAALPLAGCRRQTVVATAPQPIIQPAPSLSPFRKVMQASALPDGNSRQELRLNMILNVRERLMSHRDIEKDAARITTEITPIVEEAARQPAAKECLTEFAQDAGISLEEATSRWTTLQTADLMLESGGDPDAVSTASAIGVAQWMAGSAKGVGLSVDLPESNRLSAKINDRRCRIAWIEYLSRPDADRSAPGAPLYTPADSDLLPAMRADLLDLRERRRRIDARYDTRNAIFAQTRYLLGLYRRFPAPDWLFQAYHGGEAGVTKTLRLYLGARSLGSPETAIKGGQNGGPLSFDTLFFSTSPSSHAAAFSYLYGRSDDHRHYWYKLLAAEQVLDAYRKSTSDFHREWESSLPGRRIEAHWYPDAAADAISDLPALTRAQRLVKVEDRTGLTIRPALDDPVNSERYRVLRPAAKGALLLVLSEFRRNGGIGALTAGDLTLTQKYVDRARLLHPPKPPRPPIYPPDPDADLCIGGGPPRRFDYHTVGLAFDLLRPTADRDRKILAYTLDRLEARGLLSAIEARDHDDRRYHIVPHPAYADLFTQLASPE